ncbi:MAG TPA: MarR family transcriptional regulator [Pirellulales bacterium]|nr:MarR family transcriptional regulator [Pirellulales bacterium]
MNEELAAHGITHRQWETLAWVSFAGELSQSELAERMSIEAPTLVGVLDRMERDGWIQRVPAESDRRKKLIRPTPRVQPLWEKMVGCAHRVRARATRGMSPDQLKQLHDLLAQVRTNLGQPAD